MENKVRVYVGGRAQARGEARGAGASGDGRPVPLLPPPELHRRVPFPLRHQYDGCRRNADPDRALRLPDHRHVFHAAEFGKTVGPRGGPSVQGDRGVPGVGAEHAPAPAGA